MSAAAKAYAVLALLLLALAACVGSYFWGRSQANTKCELTRTQTELRGEQAANRTNTATQQAAETVAVASAERHTKVETKFRTIEKEVIRYVQTPAAATACLDDDGLRLWRAANSGEFDPAGPASPGHDPVPGAAATGERESGNVAGQPCADGESLCDVQGAATSAGRTRPEREGGLR